MLADARSRLHRLTPEEADAARANGAFLVDIRPAAQRAAEGELPFATLIERNVLEWRLDPASDASLPIASHDLEVDRALPGGLHLEPRGRRPPGARHPPRHRRHRGVCRVARLAGVRGAGAREQAPAEDGP